MQTMANVLKWNFPLQSREKPHMKVGAGDHTLILARNDLHKPMVSLPWIQCQLDTSKDTSNSLYFLEFLLPVWLKTIKDCLAQVTHNGSVDYSSALDV
jgi:hypothetical protein